MAESSFERNLSILRVYWGGGANLFQYFSNFGNISVKKFKTKAQFITVLLDAAHPLAFAVYCAFSLFLNFSYSVF
jgi:hypothetical protein